MAVATLEQWREFWARIGARGDVVGVWRELEGRYRESHRAYHNLYHIGHCLDEFGTVRPLAQSPDEVEAAIWFHDAIYDTHAKDNEEQSARLAATVLKNAGQGSDFIALVERLILATKHAVPPDSPDAALLVDVDLAILGQPRARYAVFEQEIRQEYSWVAPTDFAAGRGAVLRKFLERPMIYSTDAMRARYEHVARENLAWAIEQLR